jgi:hypothetical protein
MIEQGREPSSSGAEIEAGASPRIPVNLSLSSGVQIGIDPPIGVGESKGADLNKLLVLLVAVTLACGVAAGVTMNHLTAVAEDSGNGY